MQRDYGGSAGQFIGKGQGLVNAFQRGQGGALRCGKFRGTLREENRTKKIEKLKGVIPASLEGGPSAQLLKVVAQLEGQSTKSLRASLRKSVAFLVSHREVGGKSATTVRSDNSDKKKQSEKK